MAGIFLMGPSRLILLVGRRYRWLLLKNPSVSQSHPNPRPSVLCCDVRHAEDNRFFRTPDAPADTSLRSEIDYQDGIRTSKVNVTDSHYWQVETVPRNERSL